MKQALLVVLAFALILGNFAFAAEPESTIVGPVLENRYQAPDPRDEGVEPPETVEKLMDQGVIPAAEQQRLDQQVLQVPKKKL
jgi:hypothetical protein